MPRTMPLDTHLTTVADETDTRSLSAVDAPSALPLESRTHGVSNIAQMEVSADAADPLWPMLPDTPFGEWHRFARYSNFLAACIVAGLLENEGVPTIVESNGSFPDTETSAIWVPKVLMHRARWILAFPPPTEAELTFLATGELLTPEQESHRHGRTFPIWLVILMMTIVFAVVAGTECLFTGRWCGI
jgi:hypothetical protein